jgi:hypothetical protein
MSKSKPRLLYTEDYGIFSSHGFNRDIHESPGLEESMRVHGFMPSSPIQCVPDGNGKFSVIRGHHRLHYAKKLRTGVYYVIDETNTNLFDIEGVPGTQWSVADFASARARTGDRACAALMKFCREHNVREYTAAKLMHSGSRATAAVKRGTFNTGRADYALRVVSITDSLHALGIGHATSGSFIRALGLAIQVDKFDVDRFVHKCTAMPAMLRRRPTCEEYLDEIERVYNHGNRKPLALRIAALEAKKRRMSESGRNLANTWSGAAARRQGYKEMKHRQEAQCAD